MGVEGSAPGVEPDLPADLAPEVPSQPRSVDVGRGSRIGELQAAPSSRCDAFGWYPTVEATNVLEGLQQASGLVAVGPEGRRVQVGPEGHLGGPGTVETLEQDDSSVVQGLGI